MVYSKCAGTEVGFNGSSHLILKNDGIEGNLEADNVKDLRPLNDMVLIKVTVGRISSPLFGSPIKLVTPKGFKG